MRYERTYTSLRAETDRDRATLWPFVRSLLAICGVFAIWAVLHVLVVGPIGRF